MVWCFACAQLKIQDTICSESKESDCLLCFLCQQEIANVPLDPLPQPSVVTTQPTLGIDNSGLKEAYITANCDICSLLTKDSVLTL